MRTLVATAGLLVLAGCTREADDAAPAGRATSVPTAQPAPTHVIAPGTDAARPERAPEDQGFVDARGGWGWSDRCWKHLQDGRLGWARFACDEGLKVAPDPGAPDGARPSLLYNLGLVEERGGNLIEARRLFERSLALRANDEVAAALTRVGGTPAARCEPCASQEDFDAVMKRGSRCCPVIGCRRDADCTGGRVCCGIPDGQLCGDLARCKDVNRVELRGR